MTVPTVLPAQKAAATQCRDELNVIVRSLVALGLDDPGPAWTKKGLADIAATIVSDLAGDDRRAGSRTYKRLMAVLWSDRQPEVAGQPEWWRTPLGILCARYAMEDETIGVSHTQAGLILGLAKGTVASMTARGNLEKISGGIGAGPTATFVSRAAVLRRLVQRGGN